MYQANARLISRSGDVVHVALLSFRGRHGSALSKRSTEQAIANLIKLAQRSLRQGDVISRCSSSQVILMLPQANYENCQMVCERILRAFRQQHPHASAEISCAISPLIPLDNARR